MYIVFGLRKEKVDTETVLADEFSKLDMIDSMSDRNFLDFFMKIFACMCRIDLALFRLSTTDNNGRFFTGRHLFDSQPACVGFMVAASQKIFGRPGQHRGHEHQLHATSSIVNTSNLLVSTINALTPDEFDEFLKFDVLNEALSKKTQKIGDFERAFFAEAFRVFFSTDEEINSLEVLWRAY
ncbi:hypothetical protein B2M26_11865 [Ferroacidibacillus organovorans]|uniref:Uncharacterized protein n=2 Tax=Ferroacidibacillus organovorans TaxID=1765683 RepID=A0A1V4ERB6_9BACL|nr:hypothetical protein B2M26_11865 [Ferroacidibacillus organovorans]